MTAPTEPPTPAPGRQNPPPGYVTATGFPRGPVPPGPAPERTAPGGIADQRQAPGGPYAGGAYDPAVVVGAPAPAPPPSGEGEPASAEPSGRMVRRPVRRRQVLRRGRGAGAGALVASDCAAGLIGLREVGPDGPLLPVVLLGVLLAVHRRTGLYRPALAPAALDEVPGIALGAVLGWGMAAAAAAAAGPGNALGWAELADAAGLTALAALAGRALVYRLRGWLARRAPEPALVVGGGPAAQRIAAVLRAHPEYGLRPVGVAGPPPTELVAQQAANRDTSTLLPSPKAGSRATTRHDVRHAVVVGPPSEDVVRMLADRGCRVWRVGGAGRAQHLWGHGFALVERAAHTRRLGKRAMDVAVAAAVLLPLAPVLACCALAVRLADGPGVLFRQERIGLDGRPFTLLKFRTMRPRDEGESATRWNIAHDRRISPVGRVLRRTSLDELPQLWNVLRGDMSLVGPRPERPHFVEQFAEAHPGYRDRHRMPAGVTGLAQVHGLRGDTSIADRARFDNHYIDTWSLWQDVAILVRTVRAVLGLGGS